MQKIFDDIEKQIKRELEKISQKADISPQELENATKAVCLLQKMQEVEEGMMDYEDGYSSRSSYNERSSRRRGRNQINGQYMSRRSGEGGMSYNSSYDDGYSNGYSDWYSNRYYDSRRSGHSIKDRMIDRLEHMMDEAGSDYERGEIKRWIERLEIEN